MPRRILNIGTYGNDGTGDDLRTGGDKINQNFQELYSDVSALLLAGTGAAVNAGIGFVNNGIRFDGSTRDSNVTNTLLLPVDPTGVNSVLIPDSSGTIALTADIRPTVELQVDSSYVQARQTHYLDSSLTQQIVDSSTPALIRSYFAATDADMIPDRDSVYSLGDSNHRWKDIWVSGQTIHLGGIKLVSTNGTLQIRDEATNNILSNSIIDSAGVFSLITPSYLSGVASGVSRFDFQLLDGDYAVEGNGFDSTGPTRNSPDIELTRGLAYGFKNYDLSNPLWIKTQAGAIGSSYAYEGGFISGDNGDDEFIWAIPFDAPKVLYYQSANDAGIGGRLLISDPKLKLESDHTQAMIESNFWNAPVNLSMNGNDIIVDSGNEIRLNEYASIKGASLGGFWQNQSNSIQIEGNTINFVTVNGVSGGRWITNQSTLTLNEGPPGYSTTYGTDFGGILVLPHNTVAQKALIPQRDYFAKGSVIFNIDSNQFEFYDSVGWFGIKRDMYNGNDVIALVDSSYVQARQTAQDFAYSSLTGAPTTVSSFTNDAKYLDSSTVQGVIDATYIQSNQTTSFGIAYLQYGYDPTLNGASNVAMFSVNGTSPPNGVTMPVNGTLTHISVSYSITGHTGGSLFISANIWKNGSFTGQSVSAFHSGTGNGSLYGTISGNYNAGDEIEIRISSDAGLSTQNHAAVLRITER